MLATSRRDAMTAGSSHLHYTPNWNEADGIRVAKEVGYKGLFSIEVQNMDDPYEGVRRTREILLQNL